MQQNVESKKLYARAKWVIPGGVNSPVRAFKAVGGEPFLVERAEGSRLFDVDGNSYIDYVNGWGSLILGHCHPRIVDALQNAISKGTGYGIPAPGEVIMAEMIVDAIPSIEMVRMVNSGTEATMSALRLARAYTRRERIVKFEGCYHGHSDMLLVAAGSGGLTLGIPNSPGVPIKAASDTLVAPFNDLDRVKAILQANPDQIAAIIVEPVAANMGVVPPQAGFLQGLRDLTREEGIVLIFDEVITGFRVAYGGAQTLYGIQPDLTCLGKIVGGGLPVGAYGGRRQIMEMVAPSGSVYQAGTLSGNPLTMVAGIETLRMLKVPGFYQELEDKTAETCRALAQAAEEAKVQVQVNRMGSMFTLFFTESEVRDLETAKASDTVKYASFFHVMLEGGVYFAPSQFEAAFVSTVHTDEDVEATIRAASKAFEAV